MAIDKKDKEELKNLLDEILSNSATYKHIEGVNPCRINFDGVEYYVFIKNLTPAQLSNGNPDIWRIQLPILDTFEQIKESILPFILLGYDSTNDVYTTWNPHWAKQRLNVGKSVSFYSRLTIQEKARNTEQLHRMELNNDGEVIAFPREKISYFLVNLQIFFPDMSEYVAMGSRKRTEANEAYKTLTDTKNIPDFAHYLVKLGFVDKAISNYCHAIKKLINDSYISRNRKIFLAQDSVTEYPSCIKPFVEIPEVKEIDNSSDNTYSAALNHYVRYLIEWRDGNVKGNIIKTEQTAIEFPPDSKTDVGLIQSETITDDLNEDADWEAMFLDDENKITRIANPLLIDQLRPYLDTEYKSTISAFNIIEDFYSNRFPTMQIKDWQKLFEKIDWNNPYYSHSIATEPEGKKKSYILRVTYPDGTIIQERVVAKTLVEVIRNSYPEQIAALNIYLAGVNLVTKELSEKYEKCQVSIQDGYHVMTLSDTPRKFQIIKTISDALNLNLTVDFISIDDFDQPQALSRPYPVPVQTRTKVRVTLPDGRIIQEGRVSQTLVDVVKYAGVENVRSLDITINNDNLITKKVTPSYESSLKPLGNDLFVHTNSSTQTKYSQIKQISDALNLCLIIELL